MSVPANHGSTPNRILSALPDEDFRRITAKGHDLELKLGAELYAPGHPIQSIYFITAGICSVVTNMKDGNSVEVMIVGSEGIIGLPAWEGIHAIPTTHAFMQVEGRGIKISAEVARQEFNRPGMFQSLVLRQMHFTITQITQTAACNRLHNMEERFSRWLLMVQDRLKTDTFPLTHEFLAQMLGSRRSSVTLTAGLLQRAGLIEYKRGQMKILDRNGLEETACECYPVVQASLRQFLKK